ncbi:AlpA family phage regulatory protein [Salinisphaera sp. G21_0]|uniref:helix-turn-helix transcriptional regulator n=1 Tax=Salinisphaera sp. G21_0 TaxID=2821094 RepID=UPI001ADCAF31|nr:AlpA family phage regulatory protein [Salinisphaera sp. G21_0]
MTNVFQACQSSANVHNRQSEIYLSRQQVLNRYGISNTTLYRWIQDDAVSFPQSVQMGPRSVRWKVVDLEAWEEKRQTETA